MNNTFISVIIPAYNEERFLPKTLSALKANEFDPSSYEIIVVNNGSTDNTAKIAQEFGARVLEIDKCNVSAARNRGAEIANGEILAFLDADCVPDSNWLQSGCTSLELDSGICGCTYDIPEDAHWIESVWFTQREQGRVETSHINAGNLLCRKELFDALNGFDETLVTGEDTEFCSRAAKKVKLISDDSIRVVHLGNPKNLKNFIRREIWYGLGALGTFKVHWFDKPFIGTVLFAALTLSQFIAILVWIFTGSACKFIFCTMLIALLLAATVFVRRRFISNFKQVIQLFILYYFFYAGRTISLILLLRGKLDFYHNIKGA